jgi:phosphotransferase system HPr-like phosphotransfer protein
MSLGIVTGETVILSANGTDEAAAIEALEMLLHRDIY